MLPAIYSLGMSLDPTTDIIACTSGPIALFCQNRWGMWIRTGPISPISADTNTEEDN